MTVGCIAAAEVPSARRVSSDGAVSGKFEATDIAFEAIPGRGCCAETIAAPDEIACEAASGICVVAASNRLPVEVDAARPLIGAVVVTVRAAVEVEAAKPAMGVVVVTVRAAVEVDADSPESGAAVPTVSVAVEVDAAKPEM
jgi:hypothetical protein